MTRCLTDLDLERHLVGELDSGPDRAHLASCAGCQAALAAKRATGDAYMASPAARSLARALAAAEPLPAQAPPPHTRRWLAIAALGLAAALAISLRPRPETAAPEEAEVLAVEHAWMQAYLDNDVSALDSILASDYTLTDGAGGVTTKADDLRNARTHRVQFDAYDNSDVRVRVWGDTAVVTGKSMVRGNAAGRPFAQDIAFTDTLARIDGRWRAVAAHVSRVR